MTTLQHFNYSSSYPSYDEFKDIINPAHRDELSRELLDKVVKIALKAIVENRWNLRKSRAPLEKEQEEKERKDIKNAIWRRLRAPYSVLEDFFLSGVTKSQYDTAVRAIREGAQTPVPRTSQVRFSPSDPLQRVDLVEFNPRVHVSNQTMSTAPSSAEQRAPRIPLIIHDLTGDEDLRIDLTGENVRPISPLTEESIPGRPTDSTQIQAPPQPANPPELPHSSSIQLDELDPTVLDFDPSSLFRSPPSLPLNILAPNAQEPSHSGSAESHAPKSSLLEELDTFFSDPPKKTQHTGKRGAREKGRESNRKEPKRTQPAHSPSRNEGLLISSVVEKINTMFDGVKAKEIKANEILKEVRSPASFTYLEMRQLFILFIQKAIFPSESLRLGAVFGRAFMAAIASKTQASEEEKNDLFDTVFMLLRGYKKESAIAVRNFMSQISFKSRDV